MTDPALSRFIQDLFLSEPIGMSSELLKVPRIRAGRKARPNAIVPL
jgi:hypothetical protein